MSRMNRMDEATEVIPESGNFAEYPEGVNVEYVDTVGKTLNDKSKELAARFRALFVLRNLKCDRSVYWIGKAFDDKSALLKHELAYCLGQMQNPSAIPILIKTLKDTSHEPMVRHEAGESLGAIGEQKVLGLLKEYSNDECPEVAETCQLAAKRLEWLQTNKNEKSSMYDSVDPTPPSTSSDVSELKSILIDTNKPLWDRYCAMFALRDINTSDSVKAIAQGLFCEGSALFRHEVGYVLGQIQSELVIPELTSALSRTNENCMVRHEAAEALGSIGTVECEELLKEYAKDDNRIVRESCQVGLDMAKYERSGDFHYAKVEIPFEMVTLQRCSNLLFRHRALLKADFTTNDLGKLYKLDQNSVEILNIQKNVATLYGEQLRTLNECVWMCRRPMLEAINYIKQAVRPTLPSLRVVLWGPFGTGKTITLNQLLHYGHDEGFVLVHIPTAARWHRIRRPNQPSGYKPNRFDIPEYAKDFLQNFKHQNQPMWKTLADLKTERDYNWNKVEITGVGRPLTDIVEMGLSTPFTATDCIGALFRELRRYATNGSIKLMVGIDLANALYRGRTFQRRPDFTRITTDELSLPVLTKKFFTSSWTNGVCVLIADKAEASFRRDTTTIPLITPLELFGEKGFEDIDPFIPIETSNYTEEEANAIYDYFDEVNWFTKAKKSPESRKEIFYLSGSNPHDYDRLCAFT